MTTRLIKKYPNRRLYDTVQSKYITVADLKELVMQGEQIKVVDSASGDDLTRTVLLQIMMEAESGGEPLFSANMLAQIIRFYGGTMQGLFARYLEESLSLFTGRYAEAEEAGAQDPFAAMNQLAQQNLKLWSDMQARMFNAGGFTPTDKDEQEKS